MKKYSISQYMRAFFTIKLVNIKRNNDAWVWQGSWEYNLVFKFFENHFIHTHTHTDSRQQCIQFRPTMPLLGNPSKEIDSWTKIYILVWMWELDCEENWAQKNWCFWTMVLEKTLESPLDCKEIQPVHHKGDQSWVFIGRTDVEAETPILWPPDAKSLLIGKDPDAGRDWGQEEEGTTEDEMAGWRHWLDGHEFE